MSATVELTDTQLERLAELFAAKLADRLLAELGALLAAPAPSRERWLTATEVAAMLGITRDAVYRQADELGAVRIGTGPKARLRFDADEVAAALRACCTSMESLPPDPPPRQRSRPRRTPESVRAFPLLPVREV